MILSFTETRQVKPSIGVGVFATREIPMGTIVWTQDVFDQVWSQPRAAQLPEARRAILERWAHLDAERNFILCWDSGKLINHSCSPNLRGVGPWFQVARKDISAGEELCCDYAECNIDPALACECGAPGCRGTIHSSDLETFADLWDAEAAVLLQRLNQVEQPLWSHLLAPQEVEGWLREPGTLPSFRSMCAFPE